jgi:CheY-like chemotaxis protein
VVGREQDVLDAITAMLEGSGYSVTGTLHDDIAIDLAASSEFDALLLGGGMMQKEWTQLRGQVLKKLPKIKIVQAEGMESVLTLMKQALRKV